MSNVSPDSEMADYSLTLSAETHQLAVTGDQWNLTLNVAGGVSFLSFGGSQNLTEAQQNQALNNLGLFDDTDTGNQGAKFERNPDGGYDLALFDQATNTYRRVRLYNGALIVE